MYVVVFAIAVKQARNRKIREEDSVATRNDAKSNMIIVRKLLSQKRTYAREMKLAFSGCALCICMLVYFAFLVLIAVTGNFDMSYLWYIACDIFGCINPYTVLIMSKETRRHFVGLVRCRKLS